MKFDEVKKHVNDAFKKGGYNFNDYNIELSVNNRLSTTLGRCRSKRVGNRWDPYSIEIAGKLLSAGTDQEVIDVIYHEVAHALVGIETHEKHGHDQVFRNMCARIGTKNDGRFTEVESYMKESNNKIFKYDVYCPNCGIIGNYSRMCPTLKNIEFCSCNKCGNSKLYYKQNF